MLNFKTYLNILTYTFKCLEALSKKMVVIFFVSTRISNDEYQKFRLFLWKCLIKSGFLAKLKILEFQGFYVQALHPLHWGKAKYLY